VDEQSSSETTRSEETPAPSASEKKKKWSHVPNSGSFRSGDPRAWKGGAGLSNKTKAAIALAAAHAEEAIGVMVSAMKTPELNLGKCPVCKADPCSFCGAGMGEDFRVKEHRLKASQMVADRGGVPATRKLEFSREDDTVWLQYLEQDQLEKLASWIEKARSQMVEEEAVH